MKFKTLTYDTAIKGDFGEDKRTQFAKWKTYLEERKSKFSIEEFQPEITDVVSKVKTDGFVVLKNFFDKNDLMDLKNEFDYLAKNGLKQNVLPGSIEGKEEDIRDESMWYSIAQPFLEMDNVFKIAFRDDLIAIASHYFGCLPTCTGLNIRRSYVNELKDDHTQLFHQDDNSPDFFKMFIYLNDVDINGGPFCLVEGSHREKFDGCYLKYRWSSNEIGKIYGEENIKYVTANFGDLVLATTNSFHRGTKPMSSDRTMLTLDWGIHPVYFKKWGTKIKQSDYDSLEDWKKPVADYLVKE
tara:strand:+ start:8149 stop:9042 length:894 start_codon:yes stop_codon:yes gene_type:complete